MSTGSRLFERKKNKALKVLELFDQGYSFRKIAKLVHLSLRDVSKYINLVTDKTRTPSTVSIHDLIILEYRVNLLRSQMRDLELQRDNLNREVKDLRAQEYNLQIEVRAKQTDFVWYLVLMSLILFSVGIIKCDENMTIRYIRFIELFRISST